MRSKHAFFAVVVTLVSLTGPAYGKEIVNNEVDIPFVAFVACSGNGNGEFVEGISPFRFLLRTTQDAAGRNVIGFYKNAIGPEAIGRDTGRLYDSENMSKLTSNTRKADLPFSDVFWYSFQMTDMGSTTNFHVTQQIHVKIDAEGNLLAEAPTTRVNCRT